MSFLKAAFGLSGADRVADRIIKDAEIRRSRGSEDDFWAEYSQREIGVRLNATIAGTLVSRKLENAGLSIIKIEATGHYGDSVRMLIRMG